MTNTMDAETAALLEAEQAATTKVCKLPGCNEPINPEAPNRTEFCDNHKGRDPEARKRRRDWLKAHGEAATDKAPGVVVQLGGGKAAKPAKGKAAATADQIAAVEQRALWLAQTMAAGILLATKGPHREADVADIAANAPAWAASVGELAKHEEWLRSLGAGGEMSERAMAWMGFAMASAGIAVPILVRHEVIKGNMADLFMTVMGNAGQLSDAAHTAA